jgi:hypothetical protein
MLVVISPYRNREENLSRFIPAVTSFLDRRNIDYRIIISEQCNELPFNRGLLKNIGFVYAVENYPAAWYCFHDIDMVPEETVRGVDYSAPNDPSALFHLYGEVDSLGAIVLTSREAFERINGYPNNYWAWGYEDTCLIQRSLRAGVRIDRSRFVHRLNPLRCVSEAYHDRPERRFQAGSIANGDAMFLETVFPERASRNGLSTCRNYRITSCRHEGRLVFLKSDFIYPYENVISVRETAMNQKYIRALLSEVHRRCMNVIDSVFVFSDSPGESDWNRFLLVELNPELSLRTCKTVVEMDDLLIPTGCVGTAFHQFGRFQATSLTGFRQWDSRVDSDQHIVLKSPGSRRFVVGKEAQAYVS